MRTARLKKRRKEARGDPAGAAGFRLTQLLLMIRAIVATVMMMVVMFAVMVSGRIVGAVLCHGRSSAAEGHGKRNRKGCADASNKLHFCLLAQGSTHLPESAVKITQAPLALIRR
jgi:hypothetical protein